MKWLSRGISSKRGVFLSADHVLDLIQDCTFADVSLGCRQSLMHDYIYIYPCKVLAVFRSSVWTSFTGRSSARCTTDRGARDELRQRRKRSACARHADDGHQQSGDQPVRAAGGEATQFRGDTRSSIYGRVKAFQYSTVVFRMFLGCVSSVS